MVMILVMLLLKLGHQAAVTSLSTGTQHEIKNAKLEEPLTLNCTYNCSSGFTRGYWEATPLCSKCEWIKEFSKSGEMCIASLYTPHLMLQQTRYNYSCVSEESDRPGLPRKTELLVTLTVQDKSHKPVTPLKEHGQSLRVNMFKGHMESEEVLTSLSTIEVMAGTSLRLLCVAPDNQHCEGQWVKENGSIPWSENDTVVQWSQIKMEDGGRYRCQTKGTCTGKPITVEIEVIESDRFTWAKIFAAFAVSAMFVLMAHLIYLCYRRGCKPVDTSLTHDRVTSRNAVVMRPVTQDTQSDHEVPYADIVISVRGSSHPDLSDTNDHSSKLQRPKWKDEARAGQPYASSDRLHIHSREVTRKLSTTSEYAVITYSCEALS
ncbi:uncharacterized protein LOC130428160 [Triplophysa dalaica]|uniref:uncharacterized protein LOC130428160 n=1 Tax=Triplophysa dalaica TaxID=1582913 RepID=UPI0024DF3A7B|nr:uncharacterized protein LOC130428160 [Triplophysa dalaica]